MNLYAVSLLSLSLLAAPREPLDLWLYHSTNLWVDADIDRLETVWRRAANAGYKKVLLADSKFAKLGDMDGRYFKNIERVRNLAGELGLEIVPALFSLGYSNDLLWHGPDPAEGLPVKDSLFVVKGGEARLVADPPVSFPSRPSWHDAPVALDGRQASIENNPENARLVQKLKVAPFRCYHISVGVRTEDYKGLLPRPGRPGELLGRAPEDRRRRQLELRRAREVPPLLRRARAPPGDRGLLRCAAERREEMASRRGRRARRGGDHVHDLAEPLRGPGGVRTAVPRARCT